MAFDANGVWIPEPGMPLPPNFSAQALRATIAAPQAAPPPQPLPPVPAAPAQPAASAPQTIFTPAGAGLMSGIMPVAGTPSAVPSAPAAPVLGNVAATVNPQVPAAASTGGTVTVEEPRVENRPGNMFDYSPGSPGGFTAVGKAAAKLMPRAIGHDLDAANATAKGIEAESRGNERGGDEINSTLGDIGDREPWAEHLADQKEKAKQAFLQRRGEIAEEEKGDVIDVDRIFKGDHGTAKRVMSVIGMALGGYLQGYNGLQQNPFEKTMNTLIERDIEEQRSGLHAKKKSRETQLGTLGGEIDRWGDQQAAEEKIRADMWFATAKRLDIIAMQAQGEKQKQNAIAFRDQALANAANANLKFAEFMSSRMAYTPPSGGGKRPSVQYMKWLKDHGYSPEAMAENAAQWKKLGASTNDAFAVEATAAPGETKDERIKRMEAEAKGADANTKQMENITKLRAQHNLPEAQQQILRLKDIIKNTPKGKDPPGLGKFTMFLTSESGKDVIPPAVRAAARMSLSPEEVQNSQFVTDAYNTMKRIQTGLASPTQEAATLAYTYLANGGRTGLENFIRMYEGAINAQEANIYASANPSAQAKHKAQEAEEKYTRAIQSATNNRFDFAPAASTQEESK